MPLVQRANAVLGTIEPARPVFLLDRSEPLPSATTLGRTVQLARADRASGERSSIVRGPSGRHLLTYDDGASEGALAALIACASRPAARWRPIRKRFRCWRWPSIAASDIPVLINGPTGTGKEVLSRFIHDRRPRRQALHRDQLRRHARGDARSLLFGHQKGAFTGANAAGEGFFRAADGARCCSTRSPRCRFRCRLLRALQEGKSFLGATQPVKVDVRIIACANRDLPSKSPKAASAPTSLPPQRLPADAASAARTARRHRPARLRLVLRHVAPGATIPWIGEAALRCCRPMAGRAMSANWKTSCAAPCCWPGMPERSGLSTSCSTVRSGSRRNRADRSRAGASLAGNGHANGKLSNIVQMSEARAILETLEACGGSRLAAARQLGISERTCAIASLRSAKPASPLREVVDELDPRHRQRRRVQQILALRQQIIDARNCCNKCAAATRPPPPAPATPRQDRSPMRSRPRSTR
jgi:two-component system response regulator FlrC